MNQEEWYQLSKIPIAEFKEYDDYFVSTLGRVKSCKFGKERILNPVIRYGRSGSPYFRVQLYPTRKHYSVHRLVALAFNFNPLHGTLTVDHINEDTTDNRLANLQWLTTEENTRKSALGKYKRFDMETRQQIKDEFLKGEKSYKILTKEYQCSMETIHAIVNDSRLEGVNHRKRNNFSKEKKLTICREYYSGTSAKELSRIYNCAKTYIYKILKEEKEGMLNG